MKAQDMDLILCLFVCLFLLLFVCLSVFGSVSQCISADWERLYLLTIPSGHFAVARGSPVHLVFRQGRFVCSSARITKFPCKTYELQRSLFPAITTVAVKDVASMRGLGSELKQSA